MTAFSSENVAKAIARVRSSGTKQLKLILDRAIAHGVDPLVEAISAELELRGPIELDERSAEQHAKWSEEVADLDLTKTILMAFRTCAMGEEERALTRAIARNPGIGYQALTENRGKGDVALILGHMIYERLGFFRRFVEGRERMSDLLFHREVVGGRVTYRLTAEAQEAFGELRLT